MRTDDHWHSYVRANSVPIYQCIGTCKMGNDDLAVVDERLRVRGIEGLRVADASIIPAPISGCTNASAMMIGEKLSTMLLEDMDLQLRGRVALISGSTAGIGHAVALSLAREGASVIVNGRTQIAVDRAVGAITAEVSSEVRGFAGDLSTVSAVDALVRREPEVDTLVNNLGIYEVCAFENITDADWQRFFDVNVMSGVRLARQYFQGMLARNWGRVIFVSSESGYHIPENMIHYGTTKAAQIAIARGLSELTAGMAVTVNTVLPGPTRSRGETEFVEQMALAVGKTALELEHDIFHTTRGTSLLKRFATADEVASLVTYIASPLSSATNGAALRVDGGIIKSAF